MLSSPHLCLALKRGRTVTPIPVSRDAPCKDSSFADSTRLLHERIENRVLLLLHLVLRGRSDAVLYIQIQLMFVAFSAQYKEGVMQVVSK